VTEFLQATANGVIAGGVYALVAVGFSLVWSTLDVINLAHGALVVLGAYVAWLVTTKAGVSPLVGLAASAVALFVVGFSLERVVVARVAGRPTYTTLLLTFGVGLVLVAGMNAVFSDDYRSIPTSLSERSVALGPVRLPDTGIVAVGLVVLITLGLLWLVYRTRLGLAIRAIGADRLGARLVGIDARRLYALTFGIAAALAGAAGAMYAAVGTFSPASATTLTLFSFAVAVIGGVGRVRGALIGGLLLGVVESLGGTYVGGTLVNLIAFGLVFAVLALRWWLGGEEAGLEGWRP